jgi:hypothetical protein
MSLMLRSAPVVTAVMMTPPVVAMVPVMAASVMAMPADVRGHAEFFGREFRARCSAGIRKRKRLRMLGRSGNEQQACNSEQAEQFLHFWSPPDKWAPY